VAYEKSEKLKIVGEFCEECLKGSKIDKEKILVANLQAVPSIIEDEHMTVRQLHERIHR
jgi:hypothetical protein